jgi:hypothetical protein
MEGAERDLLAATVAEAVGRADVDAALTQVGWLEMLAAEPIVAVEVTFRALGAADATATVLDDVIVAALGMEPRADLAAALPDFGSPDPPGATGLATSRVLTAEALVIGGATVPIAEVEVKAAHGIDPGLGLHTFSVDIDGAVGVSAWESAVARGRVAIAHQMAGGCRAMLDLARTHAMERTQFGRPIARFQAVRHKLAEALVAAEALDAVLDAAGADPGPMTAALAKASAGRTARTVGTHCQQVLAGIGFTAEHPFHRYLKRTMVLDGLFGRADDILRDVGRQLLADRRAPTLLEL